MPWRWDEAREEAREEVREEVREEGRVEAREEAYGEPAGRRRSPLVLRSRCGRVAIHPSGDFVLTSNRGHDSVAVHRIHRDSNPAGLVTLAGIFHTRGETPRHFQASQYVRWEVRRRRERALDAVPSAASTGHSRTVLLACHLQFDKSGQWLIVANQDSDDCAVFNFNCSTGQVAFTGNSFKCPSPNFVCVWNGA